MGMKAGSRRPARARPPRLADSVRGPVPAAYLELMASFPDQLREQLTGKGDDAEQPLFRDLATVVEQNRLARREDIWTEEGPWPPDHLMIGAELGGDRFSLCTSDRSPTVHRLDHESGTFARVGSLAGFVRAVRRWASGDAATITDALATRAGKKATPREPRWMTYRREHAAKAVEQERIARASNQPTDWGDAAIYYAWGNQFDDALRCCETWIALAPDDDFPRAKHAEILRLKQASQP